MKVTNTAGGDFDPCPEGLFQGVLVDVIDRGMVDYSYQGQPKGKRREVSFVFQVNAVDEDTGKEARRDDGKRHTVSSKFTASLAQNARLVPFLEGWLGKEIPQEVRDAGFDLEALIGRNAQLVVVHRYSEAKKRTYANIKAIMPVAKSAPKLEPEDYIRVREREGYEPPFGSDDWEEQQKAQGKSQVEAPVGAGSVPPDEEDEEDDLPF